MAEMKRCTKCGIEKPLSEFHRQGKGYKSWCKVCTRLYQREVYVKKHPQARKFQRYEQPSPKEKKWCPACKSWKFLHNFSVARSQAKGRAAYCRACYSDKWIQRKYGLTRTEYDILFKQQNKRCAICGTANFAGRCGIHVDHKHSDGSIRALLCGCCNQALGLFKDNPLLLRKAATYLEKHSGDQ